MLVRAQFRLPSLESVRLFNQRLGFGASQLSLEPDLALADVSTAHHLETVPDTNVSLVRLAEQLEAELDAPPAPAPELPEPVAAAPPPAPVVEVDEPEMEDEPEIVVPEANPKTRSSLEGCKVAAIGFGRQDFGSLAGAMIEQRARIEFLPRGAVALGEFDFLLLNAGSLEIFKKDIASIRTALQSGIPAIVIGSRSMLPTLNEIGANQVWDFAAKPFHMDELVWRAQSLLTRAALVGGPRLLPARVLVADHDPFTRTLVESAMKRLGVDCELAEDGDMAWNSIEKSQPGAIILDLTLPNRDGFQLMADIRRSNGRKPKVIVLSARQSEADILRAFALGADDYVTKPFSPLELGARLMRTLGPGPEHA